MRSAPVPDEEDITKRLAGKTKQARRLRQHETEEEYRLWGDLRAVLDTILAALEHRIFLRDEALRFHPAIGREREVD